MTRIVTAPFTGVATPGPITVPEAQVGDVVLFVIDTTNGTTDTVRMAPAVIVAGEILQSVPGAAALTFVAILDRESGSKTISITGTIS